MATEPHGRPDLARISSMRSDLEETLGVGKPDLPEPRLTEPPSALTVGGDGSGGVVWTCESLATTALQFYVSAFDARDAGDTYHANQYFAAGSAFWDAYRGQCTAP